MKEVPQFIEAWWQCTAWASRLMTQVTPIMLESSWSWKPKKYEMHFSVLSSVLGFASPLHVVHKMMWNFLLFITLLRILPHCLFCRLKLPPLMNFAFLHWWPLLIWKPTQKKVAICVSIWMVSLTEKSKALNKLDIS